jgi:hypothetical protein
LEGRRYASLLLGVKKHKKEKKRKKTTIEEDRRWGIWLLSVHVTPLS